ncbi:MAG: DoxX family protein [Bacteroides sp.]|nr:DoxX family protein [Bacteroides sp.]
MVVENDNITKDNSTSFSLHNKYWRINITTWLLRIIIGGTFIFSGFVKGIDPWGTIYKFRDYIAVMSIDLWPNLIIVGVFALCALEFLCGVFLLLGCFRRSVTIIITIFMAAMLPLTLWIALAEPVADCGCFGDAYIVSNWSTFWKNVILTAGIIWLIIYNKRCRWIITPALQWLVFVASAAFIVIIELFGYIYQPLLDFRPYKVGTHFIDFESLTDDEPDFIFVYEKNGLKKEFGMYDNLPSEDDGWLFVERRSITESSTSMVNSGNRNFRIWDINGDEDITDEVFTENGNMLVIMMLDLKEVSPATTWKLNSLYEWSIKNDVMMAAVVSGSHDEIEAWEDLSMASYPIYTSDDTQIKSLVRGNPGVVYVKNNLIQWKNSLRAINIDDFLSPDTSQDASEFGLDNLRLLRNLSYIYITVIAVLIVMSFLPYLKNIYTVYDQAPVEVTHDDRVHDEE